ncbi:S8 family serine peptidase [Saccharomonospora cyanea]|uniref:Subtilisin-like serine protease n=1 Tax=Saccharomonospora cyanea NA-134 TaxID=882082 RepID=H5XHX4_9PSEU|nr:subtilisin-like serine protease [Saccharomonospora cyanea NA-134]
MVVALAASLSFAVGPPVTAEPGAATGAGTPGRTSFFAAEGPTVTLVTGDRVRVTGENAAVLPGPGRADMGFRQFRQDGDLYVVPHDAASLIAAGTLDQRLFNVSGLVEAGYHDGARDDVPVLVSYAEGQTRARTRTLADGAATSVRPLKAVNGEALSTVKDRTAHFWNSVRPMLEPGRSVEHLWLDGPVEAALDETVARIGAPEAWESGYTGEGVRVAVLDTGIDAGHPDLDDAVVEARDFTGEGTTDDTQGHGTHVAGIIAGDGTASDGRYKGVAPDADLVIGRVLDGNGSGQESWILAGMEWAAQRADVVNMSLGADLPDDGTAPLSQAVNRLTEQTGALFVVAAGNSGPGRGTIGSPASADAALTVGAVDGGDDLAEFSSRGPRFGDNAVKPEITAPGVDVTAARASGSFPPSEEHYTGMSGTSMAAPHVAGAAALVAQARPGWKADALKPALTGSATAHPELTVDEQGAGRVDVARAAEQLVRGEPAVLNFGVQKWPHDDGETPGSHTITYHNSGSEPVTLTLDTALRGPEGGAEGGTVTVNPAEVTVPANGQAEVTVTVDTGTAFGRYSGAVVADGDDGSVVRTPFGVTRESESYDVDVTVLGVDGKPVADAEIELVSRSKDRSYWPRATDGTHHVRAEKDTYHLQAFHAFQDAEGQWRTAIFTEPGLVVDRPREVVFDVRKAHHPSVELAARPEAGIGDAALAYRVGTEWHLGWILFGPDFGGVLVHGSDTEHEQFSLEVETAHARPDGKGAFVDSPYLYRLKHTYSGRVPDRVARKVTDDGLARVHSTHSEGGSAKWGYRYVMASELPFELEEYYTPGVEWWPSLALGDAPSPDGRPNIVGEQTDALRTYRPGERVQKRWNTAVQGPAFPYQSHQPGVWASHTEYGMSIRVPLYSDGAGNAGLAPVDYEKSTSTLYRDGELVDEQPGTENWFTVPDGPGSYRYVLHADRGSLTPQSRMIDAEWTFRDEGVEPGGETIPPLLGVHFDADFGMENAPRVGEKVRLPLAVQRNGSPEEPRLDSLRVEVSFDGGESWRSVPYRWEHGERVIAVRAPEGVKDVSLRVEAEDVDGNGLKQTIVGAYPVR